jgi:hypothetical protein
MSDSIPLFFVRLLWCAAHFFSAAGTVSELVGGRYNLLATRFIR